MRITSPRPMPMNASPRRLRFSATCRSADCGAPVVMLWHLAVVDSVGRVLHPFDDDILDDAGAAATERCGFLILRRVEARDSLLERRKLDHDEAMESFGAFHDLIAAATREDL